MASSPAKAATSSTPSKASAGNDSKLQEKMKRQQTSTKSGDFAAGDPMQESTKSKRNATQIKAVDTRTKDIVDNKRALPVAQKRGKKAAAKAAEKVEAKKDKKKKRRVKRTFTDKIKIALGFTVGKVTLTDPKAVEAANALRLRPSHLRKLKAKFDAIDIDGSGNIDADEFFEAIGEARTPFTDKLFALIDLDGSGTIEFDEFVRVLATYCLFTKEEILRFCFECFDVDGSGSIDEREFIELCKCVNNAAPTFPNNFKRALEEFDVNEDGLIDYAEFLEIDRRFPLVLFPAFRLQDFMQRNTLGEHEWLRIVEEYNQRKVVEEYKAAHGGKLPPDPPVKAVLKMFFPCFYREREYIKLGQAN